MSESLRVSEESSPARSTILSTVPPYVLRSRRAEIETKKGWVPAVVNKITAKDDGTVTLTLSSGGVTQDYPYPGTKLRPFLQERWQDKPPAPSWK